MNIGLIKVKKNLENFGVYRSAWLCWNRRRSERELYYALKYLSLKYYGEMTFLQVGGNDGRTGDPVHRFVENYHWKGIVVEPQKDVFTIGLQQTYGDNQNISLENCAIDRESSERVLYKIGFSNARWATGIASFDRSTLDKLIDNGYVEKMASEEGISLPEDRKDCISEELVLSMTIDQVLEKHGFENVKLLVVDTEGYDGKIIKSINFSRVSPLAIVFEWIHLEPGEYFEVHKFLDLNGYTLTKIGINCFASRS